MSAPVVDTQKDNAYEAQTAKFLEQSKQAFVRGCKALKILPKSPLHRMANLCFGGFMSVEQAQKDTAMAALMGIAVSGNAQKGTFNFFTDLGKYASDDSDGPSVPRVEFLKLKVECNSLRAFPAKVAVMEHAEIVRRMQIFVFQWELRENIHSVYAVIPVYVANMLQAQHYKLKQFEYGHKGTANNTLKMVFKKGNALISMEFNYAALYDLQRQCHGLDDQLKKNIMATVFPGIHVYKENFAKAS